MSEQDEEERWINTQIEQQKEDQRVLNCLHEWETVDRFGNDTVLQVCIICNADRVKEESKQTRLL